MADSGKPIVDELSSLRLEVVQLNERVRQMGNMMMLLLLLLVIAAGSVAAIAFGWTEVAIKVKDSGGF